MFCDVVTWGVCLTVVLRGWREALYWNSGCDSRSGNVWVEAGSLDLIPSPTSRSVASVDSFVPRFCCPSGRMGAGLAGSAEDMRVEGVSASL